MRLVSFAQISPSIAAAIASAWLRLPGAGPRRHQTRTLPLPESSRSQFGDTGQVWRGEQGGTRGAGADPGDGAGSPLAPEPAPDAMVPARSWRSHQLP